MTKKGSQQLEAYKAELYSIITALKNVESHVRSDFSHVGNDRCADSIESVIQKYQSAYKTLNSIDKSLFDQLVDAIGG